MNSISVLILTKNEEVDLGDCLASVAWCDDVHVLDSFSTDRTEAIARAGGAHFHQHTFTGYATQRNVGLALPFKHPWVLTLDADERIPTDTAQAMQAAVTNADATTDAFRMRRRDLWWGQWLKHAQVSPFYIRLSRVGQLTYEREVNEIPMVNGDVVDLTVHFDHHPFSKGIAHWIAKHNTYSSMEAKVVADRSEGPIHWRTMLFGADFNERRVHQKRFFYRLPCRPLIKLAYMLLVRKGILDGTAGIRYCMLQAIYEYFIVLKTKELLAQRQ